MVQGFKRCIQRWTLVNPAKHLKWSALRKYLTAKGPYMQDFPLESWIFEPLPHLPLADFI